MAFDENRGYVDLKKNRDMKVEKHSKEYTMTWFENETQSLHEVHQKNNQKESINLRIKVFASCTIVHSKTFVKVVIRRRAQGVKDYVHFKSFIEFDRSFLIFEGNRNHTMELNN